LLRRGLALMTRVRKRGKSVGTVTD
jgi:hypothetical protein